MDENRRPYINKINENDSSSIETSPIDSGKDYTVYDDKHHRFSIGIDKDGYIHILGDMHHGNNPQYRHSPKKDDEVNPLPSRFKNSIGGQMYWVSDKPEDISSFTFMGDNKNRAIPSHRLTYCYFKTDNNGKLYMAGRQRVKDLDQSHVAGEMGLGLWEYDTSDKNWNQLGGIAQHNGSEYGLDEDDKKAFKSIFWEPHGEKHKNKKGKTTIWYQSFGSSLKFDSNNRMHLVSCINADSKHYDTTHLVYAYSDDDGKTFHKLNGDEIKSLPIRVTGKNNNNGDIVFSKEIAEKENIPTFTGNFPGLFWDKDFSPAVSYTKDLDDKESAYRYWDKDKKRWISKEFRPTTPNIRGDHFPLSDGSMLTIGNKEICHKQSFEDKGNLRTLQNDIFNKNSKRFLKGIDDTLLRERNILRGLATKNDRDVIVSLSYE